MEAALAAGFPVTDDYNGERPEGFGRSQYSIRDGRRSSAATAYLVPARARKTLIIATGAQATRLLLRGTRAKRPGHARRSGARGDSLRWRLQHAPAPDAFRHRPGGAPDITPVVDLPVGRNLQDHLAVFINFARPAAGPFRRAMRADRMALAMVQAYLFGTGPGTVAPGGLQAFVKTRPDLAVPDVEFMFRGAPPDVRLWFPLVKPAYADGFTIRPTLLHPDSRGDVRLRSADPRDPPQIIGNFLSAPGDLPRLREGFRRARDVARQKPLDPFRGIETGPGPEARSDADVDAWIRSTAITAHHPAGTCQMGIGPDSVLDPELRVRGIERLRVVDASAMPDLVSAHINACVLMMAEKAADLIRGRPALEAPASPDAT